ncbi:hypothetical protein CLI85_10720 [Tannerella forsythia]|nr:hypothetical protein CLI85_10720 [Tannerella forsythia]
MLTVVTALKGRINSAQCEAKRSVGKKTGQPPRRRAESLNEYEFGCPFVIPNAVRNLASNASVFVKGPRAVSRRSSEQGERKSGCPSEASYLIFRPASVAKACEAPEALTFGLLLGQAKSNRKRFFASL